MSVYIIRNKETLEQWVAQSGKNSWKKSNHAKAAFANSCYKTAKDPFLSEFTKDLGGYDSLKFNDQDVYEVVEILSSQEEHAACVERKLNQVVEILDDMSTNFTGAEGIAHEVCLEVLLKIYEIIKE